MNEQRARQAEDLIAETEDRIRRTQRAREALLKLSSADSQPELRPFDLRRRPAPYPAIELCISHVDAWQPGGAKGLTVVAGEEGIGKSCLALGAALTQAELGIMSVVLDAENDPALIMDRVAAFYGNQLERFDRIMEAGLFHWLPIESGQSMREIARWISAHEDLRQCMVTSDSITTIARMVVSEPRFDVRGNVLPPKDENYLVTCTKIAQWMQSVSRRTRGEMRFLALAEMNKDRKVKGLELGYIANVYITLEREDENRPYLLRVRVRKNRSGPVDPVGRLYRFDHASLAFVPAKISETDE